MNIENTQSQMRKGILEFCILSIIRRGEAYPSDIVEEMKAANLLRTFSKAGGTPATGRREAFGQGPTEFRQRRPNSGPQV